jgi:hypothetical protein
MQFLQQAAFPLRRAIAVSGSLGLSLLSGCAHQPASTPAPSTAELCAALLDVVAQSDSRFRKFKTTPTINPFSGMTKWETRAVFPDSRCDVLEWAGGRTNYVCTWPEGTEAQSRETYEKNGALMAGCLTQPWVKSEARGQTGGALTFTQHGKPAQVVMRYFKPRGVGQAWETSLTIGDEVSSPSR